MHDQEPLDTGLRLGDLPCIRSAAPDIDFVVLKNGIPVIIIPPAITPELPSAAVEMSNQPSTVVAGSKRFHLAIALPPQAPSLKAPPLNPPKKK